MKTFFAALIAIVLPLGCTLDIGDGSQRAGQQCFQESDCADGLRCDQRICRPVVGGGAGRLDAGDDNPDQSLPDASTPDAGQPDVRPDDAGPACRDDVRRCVSERQFEVCEVNDGRGAFVVRNCPDGTNCRAGDCVPVGGCFDNDGDGYGEQCDRGPDCDDDNPQIFPGRAEDCDTRFDDNCNGLVNEGCVIDECCANGCGSGEFCSAQCVCEAFDPDVCEYQSQPCTREGAFDNGFGCFSFDGIAEPRCWGICDITAPDPDSSCPEAGSVCAFDAGDGQNGICMTACSEDAATGVDNCGPDLGCLNIDVGAGDGICTPVNPNNGPNDFCQSDSFFDCVEGFVCVDLNGNGQGRCRQGCRPFFWDGAATDCDLGHCTAFSPAIGICSRDNNSSEGQTCRQPGTACGEDAVGCYPDGAGGMQCTRLCRLDEGNIDCINGATCSQFDPNQTEIGVCF